jgi:hypothetical protein
VRNPTGFKLMTTSRAAAVEAQGGDSLRGELKARAEPLRGATQQQQQQPVVGTESHLKGVVI